MLARVTKAHAQLKIRRHTAQASVQVCWRRQEIWRWRRQMSGELSASAASNDGNSHTRVIPVAHAMLPRRRRTRRETPRVHTAALTDARKDPAREPTRRSANKTQNAAATPPVAVWRDLRLVMSKAYICVHAPAKMLALARNRLRQTRYCCGLYRCRATPLPVPFAAPCLMLCALSRSSADNVPPGTTDTGVRWRECASAACRPRYHAAARRRAPTYGAQLRLRATRLSR